MADKPDILLLRPPSALTPRTPKPDASPASPPSYAPPSLSFLRGTWHVTHSTLSKWKSARNVRITYTPIAPTPSDKRPSSSSSSLKSLRRLSRTSSHDGSGSQAHEVVKLDDLVRYQGLDSPRVKRIRGVDTPSSTSTTKGSGDAEGGGAAASWDWRGRGVLAVASSKWEVLGHGHDEQGNQWVVTYFAATLFTQAGIDIYSRNAAGLEPRTVERIKEALAGLQVAEMGELVARLFEVKVDGLWEEEGESDELEGSLR